MKKVSIITVNYNGKRLLGNFLTSIQNLNYPKELIETIVVDNASTDDSVKYLKSNYSWVKVISLKENLGFGGGNNVGIQKAIGDYLFLVNNDTVLDKNCVDEMVGCMDNNSKNNKVGAVSAKLLLFDKYLPLIVSDAMFHEYNFDNIHHGVSSKPLVIRDYGKDVYEERVFIPINHINHSTIKLGITLKSLAMGECSIILKDKVIHRSSNNKKEGFLTLNISLDKNLVKQKSVNLIQNAGNQIFRDGYGRDRGSMIVGGKQFYETDHGQYNRECKLDAFCGAGVMIRKIVLEEVGLFDENFFMYYEDDDLSFRIKKHGWKIVYCPKAVIRHIHAASSKEWSPGFIYNVERGRLLFVLKHWPRLLVVLEILKYIFYSTIIVALGHLLFGEINVFLGKLRLRFKVLRSLAVPFFSNIISGNRISYQDLKKLR